MMTWSKKKSPLKYIILCNYFFKDEEEQYWEGRIRFIDSKIDKNIKELIESNNSIEIKIEKEKLAMLAHQ